MRSESKTTKSSLREAMVTLMDGLTLECEFTSDQEKLLKHIMKAIRQYAQEISRGTR